ncbi:hypothetical protein M758_10G068400 [Ceratodon purpureus]|nr:hypothetical protein M758_10G068400 [Ceratodon purpureus]
MATNWDSLPHDMHDKILKKLEFKDLFRCKTVSKVWKKCIESDDFRQLRRETFSQEGSFTAISYNNYNNSWQCFGYDLHSKSWRSLPPFSYLPVPDVRGNMTVYSVTGHRSLMCAEVSELPNQCVLVVFNPLTGKKRILPPLLYPRNPMLVHISVNSAAKSYTIVVAGSSFASEKHLSKKVELFCSTTSKWTEASDLPSPMFGLSHHQAGVCVNGVLYVIAFLDGNGRQGMIAFDVENGKWLEEMACAIPFSLTSAILELVECDGKVHVYSMHMFKGLIRHCIHVLKTVDLNRRARASHWKAVIDVREHNFRGWQMYIGRRWQLYNEYSCVSFGDGKLCVFNVFSRNGMVYDMRDGRQISVLVAPPGNEKGEKFSTLNCASFSLQPCFDNDPMSSTMEIIENKDAKSVVEH